jgi:GMP reductase
MISKNVYLDFEDVLIKPRISNLNSRKDIDLWRDFSYNSPLMKNWKPFPVMSANMDTVSTIEMAFELLKRNWICVLHKYVSIEEIKNLFDRIDEWNSIDNDEKIIDYRNLFISRGTTESDRIKLKERLESENRIKSVCIDVANGYRKEVFEYVQELKSGICKDKILMVGNIATFDAFEKYAEIGVEIIKAGIGQGSACTTRIQTGIGVPQIGMIDEIKELQEKEIKNYDKYINKGISTNTEEKDSYDKISKVLLCSDGGCKKIGDISKAFVAGSDFVMIGGMLAGHKECGGEIEEINEIKKVRFSGMAAKESQWKGVSKHGVEEGKTVWIPYKGKVYRTLEKIEGGVRSTCTYTNSLNIFELTKNQMLIQVTIQENKIFN